MLKPSPRLLLLLLLCLCFPVSGIRGDDCNGNGVEDSDDIAAGDSEDCNGNEVPDECETAPVDEEDPGVVGSVGFSQVRVELDNFEPHSSALAHIDDDEWLDMVTMDGEDRVMVLLGDGEGGLAEHRIYSLEGMSEIIWIAAADLDGDERVDVIAVDESTENFAILINEGGGDFHQSDEIIDGGRSLSFVGLADLDGIDGNDVLITDQGTGNLHVYRNRGDGTFRDREAFEFGSFPFGLATGDFDGENGPDVAVIGLSRLAIFLNSGDWSRDGTGFEDRVDHDVTPPRFVSAGDLDGDGDLDLAVAHHDAERLGLFENDGQGVFSSRPSVELGRRPRSVVTADLDGDGLGDLVTGNERSGSVSVTLNRGDWTFARPWVEDVGRDPRFVVAGDMDRDGDIDVIAANHSSYDISLLYTEPELVIEPSFLESVCTLREFAAVSLPMDGGGLRRWTRFLVPVDPDNRNRLDPLVSNARFESKRSFLSTVFPRRFEDLTEEGFADLALRRKTRRYFTGVSYELERDGDTLCVFDIAIDQTAPGELPEEEEVERVYSALASVLTVRPLLYLPTSAEAQQAAADWEIPSLPFLLPGDRFRRGDVDDDGSTALTDAIFLLAYLFQAGERPSCAVSGDANADDSVDVADAISILLHLFGGVGPLPGPSRDCGIASSSDAPSCQRFTSCDEESALP